MSDSIYTQSRPVDSHCHLYDEQFQSDREEVVAKSLQRLEGMVIIIEDPALLSTIPILHDPRIRYAVGFHPYYADQVDTTTIKKLEETIQYVESVAAVGETGLDFYHCTLEKSVQIQAFTCQLGLAERNQLPVVIHCRNAESDLYPILIDYHKALTQVILHCYGGNLTYLDLFLELGCYISFAGNVTYPKATELHTCVQRVPLNQLLIETDAPYLAPQPVRGKRCVPEYVYYTAEKIAQLKNLDVSTVIQSTSRNAQRIFRIGEA